MARPHVANPKNRVVETYLDETDWQRLNEVAETRGLSRAAVVRHFLRIGLAVAPVVDRAPSLTDDQVEKLRRLLPPVHQDAGSA